MLYRVFNLIYPCQDIKIYSKARATKSSLAEWKTNVLSNAKRRLAWNSSSQMYKICNTKTKNSIEQHKNVHMHLHEHIYSVVIYLYIYGISRPNAQSALFGARQWLLKPIVSARLCAWSRSVPTPATCYSLSWYNIYAQTTKISCFKDLLAKWTDLTMYVIPGNAGNMSHNNALLARFYTAFIHG